MLSWCCGMVESLHIGSATSPVYKTNVAVAYKKDDFVTISRWPIQLQKPPTRVGHPISQLIHHLKD